jgi:hypothetical protein
VSGVHFGVGHQEPSACGGLLRTGRPAASSACWGSGCFRSDLIQAQPARWAGLKGSSATGKAGLERGQHIILGASVDSHFTQNAGGLAHDARNAYVGSRVLPCGRLVAELARAALAPARWLRVGRRRWVFLDQHINRFVNEVVRGALGFNNDVAQLLPLLARHRSANQFFVLPVGALQPSRFRSPVLVDLERLL